jgi:tetratricopeptide (TPR) repeat protein
LIATLHGEATQPADIGEAIQRAVDLAGAGHIAEALTVLDQLQGEQNLPANYFGLRGTLEARSSQFQKAEKDLSDALDRDPNLPDVLYTLGLVRLELNDPIHARDGLLKRVRIPPERPEPWLALGRAYSKLKDREQALKSLETASKLAGNSPAIYFGVAAAYEGLGEFAAAADSLQELLTIDASHDSLQVRCLRDLIKSHLPDEASRLAARWRTKRRMGAAQHLELGIAFAEARLYVDAVDEFQYALQLEPSMSEARYNLALSYFFTKQYRLSSSLAKELIDANCASQGHEILGLIEEEESNPMSARAEFKQAVQADPHSASAFFQLGLTELQLGNLEAARHDFSESRAACRGACTSPLIGSATAYKLEGRYDDAAHLLHQAIDQDPYDAANYLYLGDVQIRANSYEAASKSFATAIRLDPQSSLAYYMYAYAILKQNPSNAPQVAVDSLEQSIRLDQKNSLARMRLGTILMKRGELSRAEQLLADAVKLEPELRQAHLQYAMVLRKQGQNELAAKELREYEALSDERNEEEEQMMQSLRQLSPGAIQ